MPVNLHPIVLTAAAEQRRAELLAQVERERLACRAGGGARSCQPRTDLAAARAMASVLALLLAAARQG